MDLESDKLEVDFKEEDFSKLSPSEKRHTKVMAKELKEELMIKLLTRELTTKKLFEMDLNIRYMRINYRPEFYQQWTSGLTHYFLGDWKAARTAFEETLVARPHAGVHPRHARRPLRHAPQGHRVLRRLRPQRLEGLPRAHREVGCSPVARGPQARLSN